MTCLELATVQHVGIILSCFFFVKQKTAYEMRISDWSSDVCSSDLFQRPEAALVIHLAGALDPVAHVQVVQALGARPRDLPQDREGAQAAFGFVRIVEGVHSRERAFDAVGHGHAEQAAVDAELEETPVRPRADQELLELAGAVVVHAAAAMARLEVALVQGELLVGALRGRSEEHTSELQSLMRI